MPAPARGLTLPCAARTLLLLFVLLGGLCFPSAGQAATTTGTITVTAGGTRAVAVGGVFDTDSAYANLLAGVAFEKAAWVSNPAGASWSPLCTTDATGACTSPSLATGRYLVREAIAGAPAGWRALTDLAWSGGSSGTSPTGNYVGDVTVAAGANTVHPSTQSPGSTAASSTSGRFIVAKNNPPLEEKCGLDVLLLLDRSGSISAQKATYKNAAQQLVNTLSGTPTRLKIFSFAQSASADQSAFLDLSVPADVATANSVISSVYSAPAGATNWDAGMKLASGAGVDTVVFITDGNPTHRDSTSTGANSDGGGTVDLLDLTVGIAAANKVKSEGKSLLPPKGANILAVGAGTGVTALNLAAVSGPIEDTDYFTTNIAGLAAQLQQIANKLCGARIHVRKLTDESVATAAKPGWQIAAAGGSPATFTPASLTTTGLPADDVIDVDKIPQAGASNTTVSETQKTGYEFVASACVSDSERSFSTPTSGGSATLTIASLKRNEDWYCTFVNRLKGAVTVVKTADQAIVSAGDQIGFKINVTSAGPGTARAVTVSDTLPAGTWTQDGSPQCSISAGALACAYGDMAADATRTVHLTRSTTKADCGTINNTATVASTNDDTHSSTATVTVDCGLIVVKHVVNDNGGSAQASDWSLHVKQGVNEVGSSPKPGSEAGDTYHVAAGTYEVSETSAVTGYAASFSGDCDQTGSVTFAPGAQKLCKITNNDIAPQLTVVKHVVNKGASSTRASAFQMDVTATNPSDAQFPGTEDGKTITVSAGTYAVDESGGPSTFSEARDNCTGTIAPGETKTCTITNTKVPPVGAVVKRGAAFAYHGDTLTFTFEVTNPGTTPLTHITLTDDKCAPVTGPTQKLNGNSDGQLDPGERWIYSCTMAVPAHVAGDTSLVNVVTLAATDADGEPVADTDTHTTRILHPAIAIDKTGPATAVAGQAVGYALAVTNPGDVSFLTSNVNVSDAICESPPILTARNGDASPGQLDPGDSWTYTCTVRTLAGQTVVDNVANATGTDSFGGREVTSRDTARTLLTQPPPQPRAVAPTVGQSAVDAQPIAARASTGAARLAGPKRCVSGPFVAKVSGRGIAKVVFLLDGRKVRTVTAQPGRTVFKVRINPGRTGSKVHGVTARVTYKASAHTRANTLRLVYLGCVRRALAARFTG
ncbi:MAG: large repetitive protein [Solirubrobacteraceae bacterium]|nr:large repetitive protein [Solirubrobacteraceae bacterium]